MPFRYPPIPRRAASAATWAAANPARIPAPLVLGPEDLAPDGATPPVPGTCDGCPAQALAVFWRVVLFLPDGWNVALPHVVELHLCGHHADRAEATLRGWGRDGCGPIDVGPWAVAADLRPTLKVG